MLWQRKKLGNSARAQLYQAILSRRCLSFTRYQDVWLIQKQKQGLTRIIPMLHHDEMEYDPFGIPNDLPIEINVVNNQNLINDNNIIAFVVEGTTTTT